MNGRCVLLGGTFDPIHLGHVELALGAVAHLRADGAVLAVGDAHPHRAPTVLPRQVRVDLVRTVCRNTPGLVEAGDVGSPGLDLVAVARHLVSAGHELHLVFGADSARALAAWPGARALAQLGTIWAAPRRGAPPHTSMGIWPLPIAPPISVSATHVRARLCAGSPVEHLVPSAIAARLRTVFAGCVALDAATG